VPEYSSEESMVDGWIRDYIAADFVEAADDDVPPKVNQKVKEYSGRCSVDLFS